MLLLSKDIIGKGAFSTVYKAENNTVIVKTRDLVKECISLFMDYPMQYKPDIQRIDNDEKGFYYYSMPLYEKIRAPKKQLNKSDYLIYKWLRDSVNGQNGDTVYNLVNWPCEALKEYIIDFIDNLTNYTSDYKLIRFEVSPRNVMLDNQGNLILCDIAFIVDRKGKLVNSKKGKKW